MLEESLDDVVVEGSLHKQLPALRLLVVLANRCDHPANLNSQHVQRLGRTGVLMGTVCWIEYCSSIGLHQLFV